MVGGNICDSGNTIKFEDGESNIKVTFAPLDATATPPPTYRLSTKLDNGKRNDVVFEKSIVSLTLDDYTGATKYTFDNSVIDLYSNCLATRTVNMLEVDVTNNTSLNIGVVIADANASNPASLSSDKLRVFADSIGDLKLGDIKICDKDHHSDTMDTKQFAVLDGIEFDRNSKRNIFAYNYEYEASVDPGDRHNLLLKKLRLIDAISLDRFCKSSTERSFYVTKDTKVSGNLSNMNGNECNIKGDDASDATIDASGFSLFKIADSSPDVSFTLKDVKVKDAYVSGNGSAINAQNGRLLAQRVAFENCTSQGNGGALHVTKDAKITLEDVTFTNSKASSLGGAIYVDEGGVLDTGNRATVGAGGAIYAQDAQQLTLEGAMHITGNTAQTLGGGIYGKTSHITLNSKGDGILFERNNAINGLNDVYLDDGAKMTLNAEKPISMESGIGGVAGSTITKNGKDTLFLGGIIDYKGNFEINDGAVCTSVADARFGRLLIGEGCHYRGSKIHHVNVADI